MARCPPLWTVSLAHSYGTIEMTFMVLCVPEVAYSVLAYASVVWRCAHLWTHLWLMKQLQGWEFMPIGWHDAPSWHRSIEKAVQGPAEVAC